MFIRKISFAIITISLLGGGCVSVPVANVSPEEAADSLTLKQGSEIVLRETVFGVGGKFVSLFKQEEEDRLIELDEWVSGEHAKATWSRELKTETEESKIKTKEYYALYASAPVGTELPEAPKPEYVTTRETGKLETDSLGDAIAVHLPFFWTKEEIGGQGSGLIWLSKKQYKELVETRKTNVNLGLFDDSVSYAVSITDQVKNLVERIRGSSNKPEEKNVLEIEANINWLPYTLSVDGVPTTVRAIKAQNAFARYTILANEQNPLILEIMISPATRGSLNLFTREALGQAFWGYEILSINK